MPNNRICPYCSRHQLPNSWVALCYLCYLPGCAWCMEKVGEYLRHGLAIGCRKRKAQHLRCTAQQVKPGDNSTDTTIIHHDEAQHRDLEAIDKAQAMPPTGSGLESCPA